MEKVKFASGDIFNIKINGISSDEKRVRIGIIADGMDLTTIENLVTNEDNVNRIELLAEDDELLKIYTDYTVLTNLEKAKDRVISITTEDAVYDETTGELVTEETTTLNKGDVIYIFLRKKNETEERLASLEETVDTLIMSSLE